MAVWQPADYQSLYEEQKEINEKLRREIKNVIEDMRDEFAKIALPAVIALRPSYTGDSEKSILTCDCEAAYMYADGMMEARKQGQE